MREMIIIYIFFISEKDLENSDKTNDNVQKLLALSESAQMSSCSKSNIINHTDKSKRHYEPKSRNFLKNLKRSKPKKESSLFTEEDFDRFSKEYFLNSEPINKSSLDKMKQKEIEDWSILMNSDQNSLKWKIESRAPLISVFHPYSFCTTRCGSLDYHL